MRRHGKNVTDAIAKGPAIIRQPSHRRRFSDGSADARRFTGRRGASLCHRHWRGVESRASARNDPRPTLGAGHPADCGGRAFCVRWKARTWIPCQTARRSRIPASRPTGAATFSLMGPCCMKWSAAGVRSPAKGPPSAIPESPPARSMGKPPIHAAMEGVIAGTEPRGSKNRSPYRAGRGLPDVTNLFS